MYWSRPDIPNLNFMFCCSCFKRTCHNKSKHTETNEGQTHKTTAATTTTTTITTRTTATTTTTTTTETIARWTLFRACHWQPPTTGKNQLARARAQTRTRRARARTRALAERRHARTHAVWASCHAKHVKTKTVAGCRVLPATSQHHPHHRGKPTDSTRPKTVPKTHPLEDDEDTHHFPLHRLLKLHRPTSDGWTSTWRPRC